MKADSIMHGIGSIISEVKSSVGTELALDGTVNSHIKILVAGVC